LADTIERLAAEGEDLFYRGEIGQEIVTHCQQEGGHLTRDDLLHYEVLRRKPLDIQYRGSRVLTNPPPSSAGILIALALELFKGLQLEPHEFGSYRHLRLLAEVMALTQQARLDALGRNTQLLDPQFLRRYQQEVAGRAQALRGTTQLSVIDAHGNAASMTVSNGEGCGSIVPHTGIMLNNMLGEQDLHVDGFHRWTENQRMTSMMAPSLIRTADGSLIATGSGGSNRIRTALLQVIMNLIHFGMDVHQAVVSPRIHLEGQKLSVEGGIAAKQLDRLVADYPQHEVWADLNLFFGGAHTAMAGPDGLLGAGDPRRGGVCRVVE
jgi:gamma-glutamyltranspeptidase/glutathione hydrolase